MVAGVIEVIDDSCTHTEHGCLSAFEQLASYEASSLSAHEGLLAAVVLVTNRAHDQQRHDDPAADQKHGRRQKLDDGVPGRVVRENHGDVVHGDCYLDCLFRS